MIQTSYTIHLPTGVKINAKNHVELDNILTLNVCRVWKSTQIRVEVVFNTVGNITNMYSDKLRRMKHFQARLTHELDCKCVDCVELI